MKIKFARQIGIGVNGLHTKWLLGMRAFVCGCFSGTPINFHRCKHIHVNYIRDFDALLHLHLVCTQLTSSHLCVHTDGVCTHRPLPRFSQSGCTNVISVILIAAKSSALIRASKRDQSV